MVESIPETADKDIVARAALWRATCVASEDVLHQYGMRKQTVFKVLAGLGINTVKRPGNSKTNRGQVIAYISSDDAQRFAEEIRLIAGGNRNPGDDGGSDIAIAEQGFFYLLQLEPDHDPGRFKVGFAASLPERLRTLKCSAPFIQVLATWPCKNLCHRFNNSKL